MTPEQIALRASDKLEVKLFYATNKLHEYEMIREGIIPNVIDEETVLKQIESQKIELEVLNYIFDLIEKDRDNL